MNQNSYKPAGLYSLWFFAVASLILSCKKLIQIPANAPTQIVTAQIFGDSLDANSAIAGIYATNFNQLGVIDGYMTIYPGLSGDELVGSNSYAATFYNNSLTSLDQGPVTSIWSGFYGNSVIYQANAAIEGLTASTGISTTQKDQLLGECEVVRALAYFNLVNLYGPVPLVTTTNYQVSASLPRASVDTVYARIIKDLLDAQTRLTPAYPSIGKVRPNLYTALALLSRVYLYRQQWAAAETAASQIIGSGLYKLEPNLNNVFLHGSAEAIWQALSSSTVATYATAEGSAFQANLLASPPPYPVTSYLVNAFDHGDLRKTSWLSTVTYLGTTYYYPYKYKNGTNHHVGSTVEDYMLFRLGEQYLIRAEARARQNNLSGALADLDTIRVRAGIGDTTAASQAGVLAGIYHERQVELFCEWGHRWYDLKRTGAIDSVMAMEKPWFNPSRDPFYPIPLPQLGSDPFLTQNEGY